MMRKPALGDHVTVPDSFTDEVYSGVVVDLLSVQFTYETESGTIRYDTPFIVPAGNTSDANP